MVFATFTAPSFGHVHRATEHGTSKCRARRGGERCVHGRPASCWRSHEKEDPKIGQPICHACFDYEGALVWNALAPELWRRTTIYIRRSLAAELGLTAAAFSRRARVSFLKVAEYQHRGLLHFHAIIRIDGISDKVSLPDGISTADLENAIRRAAHKVTVPAPARDFDELKWGESLDISRLGGDNRNARRTAAYIAKYATKSTEVVGGLTRPVSSARIADLPVSEHVRRFIETAHSLADEPDLADLRLLKAAHQLGFRGHWTTKSRRYSTTMTALREARRVHATDGKEASPDSTWEFAGSGHLSRADLLVSISLSTEVDRVQKIAHLEVRSARRS